MLYFHAGVGFLPEEIEKKFPKEGGEGNISEEIDAYCWCAPWNDSSFKKMRAEFIQDFKLKIPLDDANKKMLEKIQNCNSVSIHIRRTDFIPLNAHSPLISYYKAVELIASKVDAPHFFIFSDDIKWCKENVRLRYPHTFVDINDSVKGYFDLELMKHCKHNIGSEWSTFSEMAAWLNENPHKIVLNSKDFK